MLQNESQEALGKLINEMSDLYGFKSFAQGDIERLRARISNLRHSYPKNKIEDIREAFKHWSENDIKLKKPLQIDAFFLNQVMRFYLEHLKTLDRPRHLEDVSNRKEKIYSNDEKWFSNCSVVLFTYGDWLASLKDFSYPKLSGMQFVNTRFYLDRYSLFDESTVSAKTIKKRYEENRYLLGNNLDLRQVMGGHKEDQDPRDIGIVCEYFNQLKDSGVTFENFRTQLLSKNTSAAQKYWSKDDSFWYDRIKKVID